MFGINLLNPFKLKDTIDTSTIVWLRVFLGLVIIMSIYVAYITTNRNIQYSMILISILCVFSLFWYLINGSMFPGLGKPIGDNIYPLQDGVPVPITLKVPENSPFTTTHMYYFVIQDALGIDLGDKGNKGCSLIKWDEYYEIRLDRTTGTLYFYSGHQSDSDAVNIGNMPFGTLVQIAIVQNQKTFAIHVNGDRRATIRYPKLPPSRVLSRSPIINQDGIISSGVLYHTDIDNELYEISDLLKHRESVISVYSNSTIFQGTSLPDNKPRDLIDTSNGYVQLLNHQMSYPKIVDIGLNSV